ncbi:cell division protein FtsY [[Pantoea] beijingensis]|uniref:Signal recognition particle receptor FtsY n=1 Tax=[Pantoea] beijingensis TaxID=1324864 RepID=A0A443IEA2_9GAMM|nr:signal recognition particle-docking protein FtsY [[Pantoea] beijingensis]RWR02392.1 cell division protein FtsY [[Pantoea] beijingensis]
MAKDKKRGFFSWLGFGRDEQASPQDEQKETLEDVESSADSASDAATLTQSDTESSSSEQLAEEIVSITETVAHQEAHDLAVTHQVETDKSLPETRSDAGDPTPIDEDVSPEAIAVINEETGEAEQKPEIEQLADSEPTAAHADEVRTDPLPDETRIAERSEYDVGQSGELTAEIVAEMESEPEVVEMDDVPEEVIEPEPEPVMLEQERPTKEGFFARLKRSLVKTRQNLGSGFIGLFRGKKIDDDLFEELEEQLLIADVGGETTRRIITNLTQQANRKQLRDAEALYGLLKAEMSEILANVDAPLDVSGKKPFVILMVGVNGVGKTTTIGKLARQYQAEGKSVMLAAGDTFRAAAVEQLQVWGQRNNIPVVAQHTGADSASVIFDAIQAARARGVDVLIADTAGRLQNKSHLMEELKKITRVMKKLDENAPHEVMLTIDASTGQNAISQTKLFHEAVGLTGITLTKLDGTAKGGVIFSVADRFSIPIRYIGVGEGIEDLRPFKADDFIEALFARED